MALTAESPVARRSAKPVKAALGSPYLALFIAALYFIALLPFTDGLASPANIQNLLAAMLPLLILATGQTIVLITGGIDLSATSIIALTSVMGARMMSGDGGWLAGHPLAVPAGVAFMMAIGALVGLFNGVMIARVKMPAFILTLTVMMFVSGFAIWFTQSENIRELPPAFLALGKVFWITLLLAIMLATTAHLYLERTVFGRWLYATGHNPKAAYISGAPVARSIIAAYVISGLCAALAAVIYTGRLETGSPVLGQRILLDVIGAAVIGGTSLFGGKGTIVGTACGVLFISLIDNSLNLLGRSHFEIMMIKGSVILGAALLDQARNKLAQAL